MILLRFSNAIPSLLAFLKSTSLFSWSALAASVSAAFSASSISLGSNAIAPSDCFRKLLCAETAGSFSNRSSDAECGIPKLSNPVCSPDQTAFLSIRVLASVDERQIESSVLEWPRMNEGVLAVASVRRVACRSRFFFLRSREVRLRFDSRLVGAVALNGRTTAAGVDADARDGAGVAGHLESERVRRERAIANPPTSSGRTRVERRFQSKTRRIFDCHLISLASWRRYSLLWGW
jgi:hypothetical protein